MGQVRHGSATTTHAIRATIQRSEASIATLSRELGINPKTVAKWRKRAIVEDLKTGPKEPRSTVPYRIHTLLTDNGVQFTNHAHHNTPSITSSGGSATRTTSSTGSPGSIIPGPMARSSVSVRD